MKTTTAASFGANDYAPPLLAPQRLDGIEVLHHQGGWYITREDPCVVLYPHTPSVMLYAVRIASGRMGWYRCLRGAHGEWLVFDLRHLAPDLEDEGRGIPTAERIASALARRYPYEAYLRAAAAYHHQGHWLPRGRV